MTSLIDHAYLAVLELMRALNRSPSPNGVIDADVDVRARIDAEKRRAEAQMLSSLNRLKIM